MQAGAKKYEIRDADHGDVAYLSAHIRGIDKREVAAVSGRSVYSAMSSGLKMSEICRVGTVDDVPFCIYGVYRLSMLSSDGSIWMLGTDELSKHWYKFGRESKREVRDMISGFRMVENYCHAENKLTVRWLKWLEFEIEEAKPFGRLQELFHRFYKRGE